MLSEKPLQAGQPGVPGHTHHGAPGAAVVGGDDLVVMAGPCAVETREQLLETAQGWPGTGPTCCAGAFKPRSSPYAFQGLGEEGLHLLREAKARCGLPVVTEVMEPGAVELVCEHADLLQIGARNCQIPPPARSGAGQAAGAAQAGPRVYRGGVDHGASTSWPRATCR